MIYEGLRDPEFNTEDVTTDQDQLIVYKVADYLFDKFSMFTLSEGEVLYKYDPVSGCWHDDGEQFVKAWLAANLKIHITSHKTKEIISQIKWKNYSQGDIFNKSAKYINLKNGVYNVETKTLSEHRPDYFFSYVLPFDYDAQAVPKKFSEFIYNITGGDAKLAINILEGFAYTFVPGYPIQKANMLVGEGANGKGTLLAVLKHFVGGENCEHLSLQAMNHGESFSLARLKGKLLNIGPDLPATALLDAGNFKGLTGGDTIGANVKYVQSASNFVNCAKIWFSANTIPRSPEDTYGYYRRWNVWKFNQKFAEGTNILPELVTQEELAGIFNLVIGYCYPHIATRLKYTYGKDVEEMRREYLKSADTVQVFADEMVSYDPESDVPKETIWKLYEEYCKVVGLIAKDQNSFWRFLEKKATFIQHRQDGAYWIKGIKTKTMEDIIDSKVLEEAQETDNSKILLEYFGITNWDIRVIGVISPLFETFKNSYKSVSNNPDILVNPAPEAEKTPKTTKTAYSIILEVIKSANGIVFPPEMKHGEYLATFSKEYDANAFQTAFDVLVVNGVIYAERPGIYKVSAKDDIDV